MYDETGEDSDQDTEKYLATQYCLFPPAAPYGWKFGFFPLIRPLEERRDGGILQLLRRRLLLGWRNNHFIFIRIQGIDNFRILFLYHACSYFQSRGQFSLLKGERLRQQGKFFGPLKGSELGGQPIDFLLQQLTDLIEP